MDWAWCPCNVWPARSPDLKPLDFFILGHLKNSFTGTDHSTWQNCMLIWWPWCGHFMTGANWYSTMCSRMLANKEWALWTPEAVINALNIRTMHCTQPVSTWYALCKCVVPNHMYYKMDCRYTSCTVLLLLNQIQLLIQECHLPVSLLSFTHHLSAC
jgi:hypothetical protein